MNGPAAAAIATLILAAILLYGAVMAP